MNGSSEVAHSSISFLRVTNTLLIGVAVASFYRFNIKVHAEFPSRVAIFMHEILGGVVIDHYLVVTVKIGKIFPGKFVGNSRKFPAIWKNAQLWCIL